MAVTIIRKYTNSTFLLNDIPKGKGYVAIARKAIDSDIYTISAINDGALDSLFINEPSTNIIVQDSGGNPIADGSSDDLEVLVSAINDTVNFSGATGSGGALLVAKKGDGDDAVFPNFPALETYYQTNPKPSENEAAIVGTSIGGVVNQINSAHEWNPNIAPSGGWESVVTNLKGDKGDPGDPTELIDDTQVLLDKTYSSSKIKDEIEAIQKLFGPTARIRYDSSDDTIKVEIERGGSFETVATFGQSITVDALRLIEGDAPTSVPTEQLIIYNKLVDIPEDPPNKGVRPFMVLPTGDEFAFVFHDEQTNQIVYRKLDGTREFIYNKTDIDNRTLDQLANANINWGYPETFRFLRGNKLSETFTLEPINFSELGDTQIVSPQDGDVLIYSGGKWFNDAFRVNTGVKSANDKQSITNYADNSLGIIWSNDGSNLIQSLSSSVKDSDTILVFNMNTDPLNNIILTVSSPRKIDGGTSYQVPSGNMAIFTYFEIDDEWKYAGKAKILSEAETNTVVVKTSTSDPDVDYNTLVFADEAVTDLGGGTCRIDIDKLIQIAQNTTSSPDELKRINFPGFNIVDEGNGEFSVSINTTGSSILVATTEEEILPFQATRLNFLSAVLEDRGNGVVNVETGIETENDNVSVANAVGIIDAVFPIKFQPSTQEGEVLLTLDYEVENLSGSIPVTIPTDKKTILIKYFGLAGDISQTIPETFVSGDNTHLYFWNSSDHKVTLLKDGGDTIDGFIDYELEPGELVELVSVVDLALWAVATKYEKTKIIVSDTTTEVETTKETFDSDYFTVTNVDGKANIEFDGISIEQNDGGVGQTKKLNFDLANGNIQATVDGTDPEQINIKSVGINVLGGGLPSELQTLDLSFNGADFAVTDEVGNALVRTIPKGIEINGTEQQKSLIFDDNFVIGQTVENETDVTLANKHVKQIGPGFYAGIKQERTVSNDIETAETKNKVFFDSTIVDAGGVVLPSPENESYTLKAESTGKTGYILYARYSIAGTVAADGYFDLILRNNDTQATIEDSQGNLMAVKRVVTPGEKNVIVDVLGYIEIEDDLVISPWFESDFSGGAISLNDRNNGNSCIMIQRVSDDFQTGDAMLQAESDLNISFRFIYATIGDDVRSWERVLQRTLSERAVLAGSIPVFDNGIALNCLSDLKVQIGTDGFEVRDDGVGLLYSMNTFFNAEETTLLKGKQLQAVGSIIQTSGPMTLVLAKWTGEPDAQTNQILTGFNISTQTPEVAANWELITVDELQIPSDLDTQTIPYDIDTEFSIPEDASNVAVILYLRPDNTTFYPTVQKLQGLTFNATPPSNNIIFAPITDKSEGNLVESDEISIFGANPSNYSDPTFPIGAIDTPIPIGKKISGNNDVVSENWSSQGPATDNIKFNVEGDVEIISDFYAYPSNSLSPGQVVNGSFWWSRVDSGGAATKIDESEFAFSIQEGQTAPANIAIYPPLEIGVQPGDKLRLYGTVDVPFGVYLKSKDNSQYFSETRVEIKKLTDTQQTILNKLSLDDEDNPKVVTSDLSFKFPSGSVSVGDRIIESGARIINTKSESIGDMHAILTQRYDGGNYYKSQVIDETNSSQVVDLQVADDTDNPGVEKIDINYITPANAHIQKIAFKPLGGTITKDFTITFKFDILDSPVYEETIDYTTCTDLGGGLFEFTLSHPSLFDISDIIHITISDIELLGGNGYDGTDGIRQGDVNYSYFFPYLEFTAIPIVYQNIATENYVDNIFSGDYAAVQFDPTTEPITPTEGLVYYDASTHKLRLYDGTSWVNIN